MHIDYLANCQQHTDTIAGWVFAEWGYLRPGFTLENATREFRERAVIERIPLALVALDGAEVIGCINIKLSEDLTLPGVTPWIGALYVRSDWRRKSVGSQLLAFAESVAARLGIRALHLSATDALAFYERRGWGVLSRHFLQGEHVCVMVKYCQDGCKTDMPPDFICPPISPPETPAS